MGGMDDAVGTEEEEGGSGKASKCIQPKLTARTILYVYISFD